MIITAEKAREISQYKESNAKIMDQIQQAAIEGQTSIKTSLNFYHDYFISLGYSIIPSKGQYNVMMHIISWDPIVGE